MPRHPEGLRDKQLNVLLTMKRALGAPAWIFSPEEPGKGVKHLGVTGAAMPRIKQNQPVWVFPWKIALELG